MDKSIAPGWREPAIPFPNMAHSPPYGVVEHFTPPAEQNRPHTLAVTDRDMWAIGHGNLLGEVTIYYIY